MSRITYNDILSGTPVSQSAGTVYAGPASGGIATPVFRALVAADFPSVPGFSVHKNGTAQSIAADTQTKLTWSTEVRDTGVFASDRFTATLAGVYLHAIGVTWDDELIAIGKTLLTLLYKNGSVYKASRFYPTVAPAVGVFWEVPLVVMDEAAVNDYYEVYVYQGDTDTRFVYGGAANTYWSGQWMGRG